jgi:redox-sensing transcriptional repressor
VIAVPADNAQQVADDLVGAGVKIIFNYSEALLDVPEVTSPCTRRTRPSSS